VIQKPIRKQGFLATLRAPKAAAVVAAGRAAVGRAAVGRAAVGRAAVGPAGARGRDIPSRAAPARGPVLRTVTMGVILLVGGSSAGIGLVNAANREAEPFDFGPPPTIAVPSTSPEPGEFHPMLPRGATVAVAGDSVGLFLAQETRQPTWLGDYLTVVNGTKEGCGFSTALMHSPEQGSNANKSFCSTWQSEYVSKTSQRTSDPDLVLAVIGAWDVFDVTVNGERLAFGSAAWDQYFNATMRDAIDFLRTERAGGTPRPVGLLLLACFRPTEFHRDQGEGYWGERGDDNRTRHVNDLLRAIAEDYETGVFTVDPPDEFCTDGRDADGYAYATDEQWYRFDGVHPIRRGTALYWTKILTQLMAPDPAATPTPTPTPGPSV
jgi:hypothetical protein